MWIVKLAWEQSGGSVLGNSLVVQSVKTLAFKPGDLSSIQEATRWKNKTKFLGVA